MHDPATILFTLPEKKGDPTYHTAVWGRKAVAMAKSLGYNVVVLQKEQTTYQNVTNTLEKYNPRMVVHYGHGCKTNIQGQNGCIITRNYNIDELLSMAQSPFIEDRQKLLGMLNHLGELSCPGICSLENDPCASRCREDTNVSLLKNKIVYTTACYSADQLGKCAIQYGADSYTGADDLFLFPVDRIGSQDIFGDLQLLGLREILLGHSVGDAEAAMSEAEDKLITKFKPIKYMALSLLWNKLRRRTLGNWDITIY